MTSYASIMVQAYSLATGKSIQDSLVDLKIDNLIDQSKINLQSQNESDMVVSLKEDVAGVSSWARGQK